MGTSGRASPKRLGYVFRQPQNCRRFKALTFADTHTVCAPEWSANPTPHAEASGTVWLSFPGKVKTGNHRVSVIAKNHGSSLLGVTKWGDKDPGKLPCPPSALLNVSN